MGTSFMQGSAGGFYFLAQRTQKKGAEQTIPRVLQPLQMYVKLWRTSRNNAVIAPGDTLCRHRMMPGKIPDPTPTQQWAVCTILYSEQVSKIFGTAVQGQGSYQKAAIDVLDVSQKYLQQTLNLSSIFGLRFYHELDNIRRGTVPEPAAKR
jgi:hypothetical protein